MKLLNDRGGILVEFIIVTPVIVLLIYAALNLNGRIETKLYLQNSIGNLKGVTPPGESGDIDDIKAGKTGIQYATFSKTLRNYQQSFDEENPFGNINHTSRILDDSDDIRKVKIGSYEYKTLLKFQKFVSSFLYNGVIEKLSQKGIYFNSKQGLEVDIFEFNDGYGNLLFDKELSGIGAYIDRDDGGFSPMNFVEKIVYQTESGYHPASDQRNITLPGAGLAFLAQSNHWGVLSSSYYSGAKASSEYRTGNALFEFMANAMSTATLLIDVIDEKILDKLNREKSNNERERIKQEYAQMDKHEKKKYIEKLQEEGKINSNLKNKVGKLGDILLKTTKLKKGFTLNCPFNYRVGSNCITTSMYGTLLPVVAILATVLNTVGDFLSSGSYKSGRAAVKAGVKEGVKALVDEVANKIKTKIEDQVSEEIGKVEEEIKNKIRNTISEEKKKLFKKLMEGNTLGITK